MLNLGRLFQIENQKPASHAHTVAADYAAALVAGDGDGMRTLRTPDFALDFVHDGLGSAAPLTGATSHCFWPLWFAAFSEREITVTQISVAQDMAVVHWTFAGRHTGLLRPPVLRRIAPPTGRTVRLRGMSICGLRTERIHRETVYMDLDGMVVPSTATPQPRRTGLFSFDWGCHAAV